MTVQVGGAQGTGTAGSKRAAEQLAAADLLQTMARGPVRRELQLVARAAALGPEQRSRRLRTCNLPRRVYWTRHVGRVWPRPCARAEPPAMTAVGMTTRCGFVAIVGAPNAGKSTLLNRLTGAKLSIVSPKAQTTRFRVLGILMRGDSQVLLVDTPGIFRPRRRLDRAMVAAAWTGAHDADLALLLVDAKAGATAEVRGDRREAGARRDGAAGWC